ncbi:MAG: right-handed parallel beta-helix repeat-containing protein [Bacteroidota bacterium]|nr:right-handed parallel beta-helix repeat-containing protein [Bacteroidota bacterium]
MKNNDLKKVILLVTFLLMTFHLLSASEKSKNILEFGAIPNDGLDDSKALKKATAFCRSHPGYTLVISPGTYDFKDSLAKDIEYKAISGFYGEDVQGVLFKPGAPYVQALDFSGSKDISVIAEGATLCLDGWYEPVSIIGCKNFKIKGLSITYKRHPNTVGKIIQVGADYFDVDIDTVKYPFIKKKVTGRIHFYDTLHNKLYALGGSMSKSLINSHTIRVRNQFLPNLGDLCIIRHSGHYRPAILIKESKNVVLEDVKIHSQPGMGVVGHLSENISLKDLQVIPEVDDVISTNTDATHFTSCKGHIIIDACKFGGQGDDCVNIHNYFYTIYPSDKRNIVEIRIEKADLHAQSLDYPEIGDTLLLVNRKDLLPVKEFIVKKVNISEKEWKVIVQINGDIPSNENEYYLTNLSKRPSVILTNNTVRSNQARAFLLRTNNVLIKGNVIQNSTGTAIELGAETNWRESGPVKNVLIEDNWIIGCGYGIGTMNQTSAICVNIFDVDHIKVPLNKSITIRNNSIIAVNENAIFISGCKQVNINNNNITGCKNSVFVQKSTDVTIRNNGDKPVKYGAE